MQPPPPPVFAGAPPAAWVAPAGPGGAPVPADSPLVFRARRAFALAAAPRRFVVHVSGDNRYRLFVNGREVAAGPQRSDVAHWRYETVDLAPHLRAGPNVLAALVWSWGRARPLAQHTHRAGLVVQGDGPAEAALVNTGPAWRVLADSAWAPLVVTPAMMGTYYAAAPGDSVDGRRVPWGWEAPAYDDRAWPAALPVGPLQLAGVPRGGYGEVDGWQLLPRALPAMEETPERLAAVRRARGVDSAAAAAFARGAGPLAVPPNARAAVLFDQGRTTNAFPLLTASGGRGAHLSLTYAEAPVDSAGRKGHRDSVVGRAVKGVRDAFVADGGAGREFRPVHWRSFRYVQLDVATGEAPLRLDSLRGLFTAYPLAERARFASDLPWLGDVWALCRRAVRLSAYDTFMDTPYWEQLQYAGDARVEALLHHALAADGRLARQAIEQLEWARTGDGLVPSRAPSTLVQVIPPFALVWVLMVHDYHRYQGDPAFVRGRLAAARGVLDWYAARVDATGLLGPTPHWNFLDWVPAWDRGVPPGGDRGHASGVALLYALALRKAAELERALGAPGLGAGYDRRADAVIAAVRARTWDPARGLFRDAPAGEGPATYGQQANALAVLAGAAPRGEAAALMARVLDDRSLTPASYYFRFYVHEAMAEAGLGDRLVGELAPWRAMPALGLTSTPEAPEPSRSDTHAWSAHPAHALLATVLGVRPGAAGFGRVVIAPALGPLARAEGRVPTPRGDVDVRLARAGARGLVAEVTTPVPGVLVWRGRRVALRAGRQRVRVGG